MRSPAVLLLFASTAAAAPPLSPAPTADPNSTFSFIWEAPPGCPARAEVLGQAEHLAGRALTRSANDAPISLAASVRESGGAWQLRVESGASDAPRAVSARSCSELGDAMALLIALSLDPEAALSGGSPKAGPAHVEPLASAAQVPSAVRVASAPLANPASSSAAAQPASLSGQQLTLRRDAGSHADPRVPAQYALAALAAVGAGRRPGAALGGVFLGQLSWRRWALGLDVGYFPAAHEDRAGHGADLSLATLRASSGYSWFHGALTPYVALELDRLHGLGTGLKVSQSGNIWLLGADLGLRLSYPLQRSLKLLLDAQATLLLQQGRFVIDPDAELFRPSRLSVQLGLGAELRIR